MSQSREPSCVSSETYFQQSDGKAKPAPRIKEEAIAKLIQLLAEIAIDSLQPTTTECLCTDDFQDGEMKKYEAKT